MKKTCRETTSPGALMAPALFASYRINDYPAAGLRFHPWRVTKTTGVLLNAYDLLGNHRTRKCAAEIRESKRSLGEHIQFSGPVMLDSGAFNFLRHEEISITAAQVLDVALELRADICVVLDHPFPPHASPDEIADRLKQTRDNTRAMVRRLDAARSIPPGFRLMPVLHGHDERTLTKALHDVRAVIGHDPEIIGIGSLAPLAQNGSKKTVVDIIRIVRSMLPSTHIHCFSMGSALLMLLAFFSGADTVDSQTWMMSAAFKYVQLPGFYMTRFSRQAARRDPNYQTRRHQFARHLVNLSQVEDYAVRDWETGGVWPITDEKSALGYLDYLVDSGGANHVHRRACHNLYAFNFEAKRMRQMMKKTRADLESFIQSRLHSTIYMRTFDYAKQHVS